MQKTVKIRLTSTFADQDLGSGAGRSGFMRSTSEPIDGEEAVDLKYLQLLKGSDL